MDFRFKIIDEEGNEYIISEPEGFIGMVMAMDRHPDFYSVVESCKSSISFYGETFFENGGRDLVKRLESNFGPDTKITAVADIRDDSPWEELFRWEVPLAMIAESLDISHDIEATFSQADFWTKFISRFEIPVNLRSTVDLDGNAVSPMASKTLQLISQIIDYTTVYSGHSGDNDTLAPCETATTGNIVLSGHQTIGGILTTDDMRVLVKAQSDNTQNGTYTASSGAWSRTTDANTGLELEDAIVKVNEGTQAGSYRQTTKPVTLGVDPIVWIAYNYVDNYLLYENTTMEDIFPAPDFSIYIPATVDVEEQDEIDTSVVLPVVAITDLDDMGYQIEIMDGNGPLEIIADEINYSFVRVYSISGGVPEGLDVSVELFYQLNDEAPVSIDLDSQSFPIPPSVPQPIALQNAGSATVNVRKGDLIRVFTNIIFATDFGVSSGSWLNRKLYGGIESQSVRFVYKSLKADTTAPGFLLHDAMAAIADRYIGGSYNFYSELLGSNLTSRVYAENGEYWKMMVLKGLQLRGYSLTEKANAMSGMEWWKGANPIFNLGIGYDVIDGKNVIRCENKEFFFDDSSVSVNLSNIRKIRRIYDQNHQFNQVKNGYMKWEPEDVSGIDDPQAKQTRASRFRIIGKGIEIMSDFIAASLAIETTRRTTRQKSADYKYDNNDFIVSVEESGSVYTPEFTGNFSSVTGLNNPDRRYNIRLSPARNFLRWLNFVSGCLQDYLTSVFRFTDGEGNYKMASTMTGGGSDSYGGNELAENEDIQVSSDFLFLPIVYEIEHYLTLPEYKAIRNNRNKAIGISLSDSAHKKMFIRSLEYMPTSGDLKLTVWAKEYLDIRPDNEGPGFNQDDGIFDYSFDDSFE